MGILGNGGDVANVARKTNWWFVFGGAVLILCGIGAFVSPVFFLEYLTIFAGVGFVISGISGMASYFQMRKTTLPVGGIAFMAVLDIVIGALLIVYPLAFANLIPWLLGVAFIVFGALELIGILPFGRFVPESRPIMVIAGVLAVVVGIMLIVWPTSLALWIAAFALVRGISLVAVGFTLRP